MEYNFKRGQKLLVELDDSIYEGIYESGTNDRIDLTEVKEYPCGEVLPVNFSLYRCEILDLKILDQCNGVEANTDTSLLKENNSIIKIKEEEYRRLQKSLTNYTYICNLDKRYYDLIELIKDCGTISILGIASQLGRLSKLNLIVISVCTKLYILDIKLFKHRKVPDDLKDILQSESIKKITFSGKWFADSLYHCHNIKNLSNMFEITVCPIFFL